MIIFPGIQHSKIPIFLSTQSQLWKLVWRTRATYNNTIIKPNKRCVPMYTPSNTLLCKRRNITVSGWLSG